jgi:hypothetical protein
MEFGFMDPKVGYEYSTAGQDEYEWKAETTVLLGPFSVYILDPHDDENYMQSARFPKGKVKNQVRIAMVFRWLTTRVPFYTNEMQCAVLMPSGSSEKLNKGTSGSRS